MKTLREEYYYNDEEFYEIINDIISLKQFKKLKKVKHHGITRYNHSLRVAYYTYLITKKLHFKYKQATRAALLHDFFTTETKQLSSLKRLKLHPEYALKNAEKYFELTALEKDIIKKHMFPITIKLPRYIESWIVDFVDDIASFYERTYSINKQLQVAYTVLLLFLNIKLK